MDADELMQMLDLEDAQPVAADGDVMTEAVKAADPTSEYAVHHDAWSRRRGVELVEADKELRVAAGLEGGDKPRKKPAQGEADPEAEYWGKVVADFHAAAYEPAPELVAEGDVKDRLRRDFLQQAMETQEFQEMRNGTVLNPVAAEIATACFAKQFAVRMAEAKRDAAQGNGPGGGAGADSSMQTLRAAAAAVSSAAAAVQEVTDAADALGLGTAAGKRDAKRIQGALSRVKKSKRLAQIAKLAGRFRRLAASKQRQKVTHGADEVVGVTLDNEIAKLVPAELCKLADPTLALDTARRLFDRQTLCRETRATEPVGKGPIVVVVDESGSMDGERISTAKALALALAWIARKQRRWCCLVSFSDSAKLEPGSSCLLRPGATENEGELMNWLEHFYGGGTSCEVPLRAVPQAWPDFVKAGMSRGKTDMIVISDAQVGVPAELQKSFMAFKAAEKCRLTSIIIQGQAGDLGKVSDEVFEVPALDINGDAVGKVLSV